MSAVAAIVGTSLGRLMSTVETAVKPLEPGDLRKAIQMQRRHRGREIVKATISFDDYFNLRERSFCHPKWRGFMHEQPDGSWKAFGVLLDYGHDSWVERTLTVRERYVFTEIVGGAKPVASSFVPRRGEFKEKF